MEVETESEVSMNKKLVKIGVGIATLASTFYWGVLPAFAEPLGTGLCPDSGKGPGFDLPGCKTFSIGATVGSLIGVAFFVSLIIALGYLIMGGIKWIMSGGEKEGTQKAKDTVTSALIGLAVVISAFILINILLQVLTGTTLNKINIPQLQTQ